MLEASPLRWYEHLWTGWPIVLAISGGLIGGACGGAAWAINRKIFGQIREPMTRYVATGLVSAGSVVCYLAIASAVVITLGKADADPAISTRVGEFVYDKCTAGAQGVDGLSDEVIASYCHCATDKLLASHTLPELRQLEDSGESAVDTSLEPIIQQCVSAELAKTPTES
jgi:hypothetical protein